MTSENPNRLIVEGPEDLFSVVALMRAHVPWPNNKEDAPVNIERGGGVEEILREGYLTSVIKMHAMRIVGIMLDADTNPSGRYVRLRSLCSSLFPAMPNELPANGLVVNNDDNKRLGVWIMPDNVSEGNIETFLKYLVREDSKPLWNHGVDSLARAKELGAPCRDCHDDKASLYTWLAWQDPPAQRAGAVLTRQVLDPQSPSAIPFVEWFKNLYGL